MLQWLWLNLLNNQELGLFDAITLFSAVNGIYNLDLNERQRAEQMEDKARIERIERKLDILLNKMGCYDGNEIL